MPTVDPSTAAGQLREKARKLREKADQLESGASRLDGVSTEKLTVPASSAILNIPPIRWTVPGLIHSVGVGFMASEPFVGKTLFLTHLAVCVASGRTVFANYRPMAPTPVLYLYGESNHGGFLVTLRDCMESLGTKAELLHVNPADAKLSSLKVGRSGLESSIRQTKAKLVILDTLSFFSLAKENDNDEVQRKLMEPVIDLSKRLGCFFLFVHHEQKGASETKSIYRMRGGTVLSGAADVMLRLERDPEENETLRILHLEKVRGAKKTSLELAFDFGRKVVWAKDQDPREVLLGLG